MKCDPENDFHTEECIKSSTPVCIELPIANELVRREREKDA